MSSSADRFRAALAGAIQGRYGRSVLGRAWLVLSPVALVATITAALHQLVGASQQLSVMSLVLGLIFWNFFAGATSEGIGGIPARRALLQSGPAAAQVLVSATVAVHFLEMLVSLSAFVACQLVLGPRPQPLALQAIVPVAELVLLTLGIALVVLALRVRLGDADQAWKLILAVGFWITPVVYEIQIVPERMRRWVELNPLARIIGDARGAILHGVQPDVSHGVKTLLACAAVLLLGRLWVARSSALIAERA